MPKQLTLSAAENRLHLRGERLRKIECIETRRGWRFDYEGMEEDVPEAMSILEHGF